MIYVQVRIKGTPEGFNALNREMAEYNRLMSRDGATPIANFVVRVGNGTGDQIHLFGYQDVAAYAAAMDKMAADPEWGGFLQRVGALSVTVDISILKPLPDSPLQ